jgi:isochorismate synthase
VNLGGGSTLYVNLRCMQLRTQSAALYVGAGITADSDPAAEWRETELKARTILDALAETALPARATNGSASQRQPQACLVA